LWKKEGWSQQNPMTADSFAEIAMDFCSRNSFDRPPQAPRPPSGGPAASSSSLAPIRPAKRMHEMSEEEQLRAAMQASISEAMTDEDNEEILYVDDSDSDGNDAEVQIIDSKPQAIVVDEETKPPTLNEELLDFVIAEEPMGGGCRIQVRFPDGKRSVRKFSSSDTVRTLYAFVAVRMHIVFRDVIGTCDRFC
jgi:UBX domain-containing protein 7